MSLFETASKGISALNDINIINQRRNYANSMYSLNEEERKISSVRNHCHSKLTKMRLQSVFLTSILPMLILFLLLATGVGNGYLYGITGAWMVGGFIWAFWNSTYYTMKTFRINNSNNISIDDCGF